MAFTPRSRAIVLTKKQRVVKSLETKKVCPKGCEKSLKQDQEIESVELDARKKEKLILYKNKGALYKALTGETLIECHLPLGMARTKNLRHSKYENLTQ